MSRSQQDAWNEHASRIVACPYCQAPMRPGLVTIVGGRSYNSRMWFIESDLRQEQVLLTSERRLASMCPQCKSVSFTQHAGPSGDPPPNTSRSVTCEACSESIPAGQMYCTRCQGIRI